MNDFEKQMQQTKTPDEMSVNGKAMFGVQKDATEGIRRGLEQLERGEGRPADVVFAEFRAGHNIANSASEQGILGI